MIFESKEEFMKHYESLTDDFDKTCFMQDYIDAMKTGDLEKIAHEPDRFTADETNFKVYRSRFYKPPTPEEQAELDKYFEDKEDEFIQQIDTDVDFQLNAISKVE